MGTKHDVLTEDELATFQISPEIRQEIERFIDRTGTEPSRETINILDWGCGRGRSVAKLREEGFNAYGVDIDECTMRNGYSVLTRRGLDPTSVLLTLNDTSRFSDGFFHCICSDQVLEHVRHLPAIFSEMWRLTAPGGIGIHHFPGSRNFHEGHLCMPLVHWLPKNSLRRAAIAICLKAGAGPTHQWPETEGCGFWSTVDTYYRYLNDKTYYRDIDDMCAAAAQAGFHAEYKLLGGSFPITGNWLPATLRRNGFPGSSIFLVFIKAPIAWAPA